MGLRSAAGAAGAELWGQWFWHWHRPGDDAVPGRPSRSDGVPISEMHGPGWFYPWLIVNRRMHALPDQIAGHLLQLAFPRNYLHIRALDLLTVL